MFQKLDPQSAPTSTQDPKTPLKGLRRAKIGTNASHSVQLTTLGPKKPDLNPTPQRSVPFTWNPPDDDFDDDDDLLDGGDDDEENCDYEYTRRCEKCLRKL